MAELAIKGHSSRGKEVIEILEMLGGKNVVNHDGSYNRGFYFLDTTNIICHGYGTGKLVGMDSYTLEEFLEKYPYKVGDEIEYKSIGDANLKSKIIYMKWCKSLNKVLYTTEDAHVISTEDIIETKAIPPYMDYDIKEDIEKNQPPKTQADVDKYLQEHSVKNGMKVFGCKRTGGYSGGLIIVAANSLNEAFETFAENYRYRWMTSVYPRSDWFEIPELVANIDNPRVISEGGYTE